MFDTLKFETRDGIGLATLNRPDRLNAINPAMGADLTALCASVRADDSLRALIITGAGRAFCAGADIEALAALDGPDDHYRFLEGIQLAMNAIEALPVPTIAALNGVAYGGGCELAIACDFRIMSDRASLGVPEVKLGLLPGAGGTQRLSRLLPPAIARQMIYLGEPLSAASALQHGLVNEVAAPETVMPAAREWASRIAALAPAALRSAKLLVRGAAFTGLENGIEAERQAVAFLFQTEDAAEGLQAFLDKRAPQFTGR